jgi:hypothetical protein
VRRRRAPRWTKAMSNDEGMNVPQVEASSVPRSPLVRFTF